MGSRFFSKIYSSWEKKQTNKYKKILDILRENSIDIKNCKCVNIGCCGFFLEKFLIESNTLPKNFLSIDVDKYILKDFNNLRKRLFGDKINFVLANGERLPFYKDIFDLIFCIDVIHLLKDTEDIYFTLKRGGYLIVSSFFNFSEKEKIREKIIHKLDKFKILKEVLLIDEENEIIFLANKQ